ncbi:MAG: immunoglobulin domain-containing protein [Verrucomicrobiales bacterium]
MLRCLLLVVLLSTGPLHAAEPAFTSGETAVTLDIGHGIRVVPPSRVTVPLGETLLITGPSFGGRSVQWLKNGRFIPGATGPLLAINRVASDDAGVYFLMVLDPLALIPPSQSLILGVGPTDRLLNLSTRGVLAAGAGQNFTSGFVVGGTPGHEKKLIVRAIGPSLALFGIANPQRAPVLRIFDSTGKPYVNGFAYPTALGSLTYETDLATSLARSGAFPLSPGASDVIVMMPFAPGAYTAQVTSEDQSAGTVLLEVYEVP